MRPRLPAAVWGFASAKVVLHLATTRLGFHRDELYFIAASRRLAWSYVDFQPVTPALVRATRAMFGDSLLGLRLIPALAGAAAIVLAALIARELGADRRAQTFAAFALLVVPLFVGMNSALNTVSLETPAWMLVAFVLARMVRTEDERLWAWLGAALGLALLVKFTVLAYVAALAAGILLTPLRQHLRGPWPYAGALVSLAMIVPSLMWQASNGFPVVEFVLNQETGGRVAGLDGRGGYLASLLLFPGPVALLLIVPGMVFLWSRKMRPLGVTHAAVLLVFLAVSGKGYYASPALAVLVAAGAVAAVTRAGRWPRLLTAGLVLNLAVPFAVLVPVMPASVLRDRPDLAEATELGERVGWEDLALSIRRAADGLSEAERDRAFVLGSNYAIPAAWEMYGDGEMPAVSGHNSAFLWWPRLHEDGVAIAVGFDERQLRRLYGEITYAGRVTNRHRIENYEWGRPIYVARDPKASPEGLRELVRRFTA